MAARSMKLAKDSPLHKRLVMRVRSRVELGLREQMKMHDTWRRAEETTLAYVPESSADNARASKRDAGIPKYTTIMLPYTYAMLLSAHTYWTSVFFARTPVHQYTGRHGEGEMQVQAIEALMGYQMDVGGALGPYYIWLYDVGKYGQGILGEYWDREVIHYGEIVQMDDPLTGQSNFYQATKEVQGYEGNRLFNVSVYDFLHDPRVPFGRMQDGEFCARRVRMLWHDIQLRKEAGYYTNLDDIHNHRSDNAKTLGASILQRPQFDFELKDVDERGNTTKNYSGCVFWEVYIKICPKDWGLGDTSHPQIWCFTITEDLELVVGASPLGLMHGRFPFMVGECEIEGYGIYGRGLPQTMEPLQQTMDWLINTHFYNVRAALNNQFIIDPSKIVIKDAQHAGPGFIWRLRPEAYGTDLRSMFMQVPVSDVTRANISDLQVMQGMAERSIGVNDQIMGVLNTGGRKTATEVRTSTGFGVNRQKTITEYLSGVSFGPHSQRLLQTTQQMYSTEKKLRIAGSFAIDAGPQFIDVTPEKIAGYYDFVSVDGTLPVDRMAQANLWKEIMATIPRAMPQIAAEYDFSRIFAWTAQLGGLKNIHQFKVQVLPQGVGPPPGAIPAQAPLGLPGPSASPGASASTQAGLNALGGESGY